MSMKNEFSSQGRNYFDFIWCKPPGSFSQAQYDNQALHFLPPLVEEEEEHIGKAQCLGIAPRIPLPKVINLHVPCFHSFREGEKKTEKAA